MSSADPPAAQGGALSAAWELARMLEMSTCFDALPKSGKAVVFDVGVPVRLALFALVEHELEGALLWDSSRGAFSGTITVTDLIDLLVEYHRSQEEGSDAVAVLASHTLLTWKECRASRGLTQSGLVKIHPDASLLDACALLRRTGLHRLAVVEDEDTEEALEEALARRDEEMFGAAAAGGGGGGAGGSGGGSGGGGGGGGGDGDGSSSSRADAREVGLEIDEAAVAASPSPADAAARRAASAAAAAASASAASGEGRGDGEGWRARGKSERQKRARERRRRRRKMEKERKETAELNAKDGTLEDVPTHSAVLGTVTHHSILAFIADNFASTGGSPTEAFPVPVGRTGIGTWGADLLTMPYDAPLIAVLQAQLRHNVSAVPLVNPETGELVDIWAREDVLFLTHDPSLKCLDMPIHITRSAQLVAAAGATSLRICSEADPLGAVLDLFAASRARRVVAIDDAGRPVGIVSLSDVFHHLVLSTRLNPDQSSPIPHRHSPHSALAAAMASSPPA